jgi:hypothetical protein
LLLEFIFLSHHLAEMKDFQGNSNQFQALDLSLFGISKQLILRTNRMEPENIQTKDVAHVRHKPLEHHPEFPVICQMPGLHPNQRDIPGPADDPHDKSFQRNTPSLLHQCSCSDCRERTIMCCQFSTFSGAVVE